MTLVDITETGMYRRESGKDLERDQQQNFVMLLQTIGMRINPIYEGPPIVKQVDLKDYNFGSNFKGLQSVWFFTFGMEFSGGFTDNSGNEYGLLEQDLHLVPVTPNLTETVKLVPSVFNLKNDKERNTLIAIS